MLQKVGKRLKDQKGLTLVELLAVIVILGIIAAIAIPSIGGLINKTRDDAKVAEGIQIIDAAKLYVTSNPPSKVPKTLSETELADYLDNVKDKGYNVTVDKDNKGKFTYELTKHNSVGLVGDKNDVATESELLNYKE